MFEVLPLWLLLLAALLLTHWIAISIHEEIEHWSKSVPIWVVVLCMLVLLTLVAIGLESYRRRSFLPRTRDIDDIANPPKRKHLLLFLSYLRAEVLEAYRSGQLPWSEMKGSLTASLETVTRKKNDETATIDSRFRLQFPWEMPLRAIAHNLGELKSITIICSRDSASQAKDFVKLLDGFDEIRSDGVAITLLGIDGLSLEMIDARSDRVDSLGGLNFEGFNKLAEAIGFYLRKLSADGVRERDIVIDITGGQKPTSVVAAAVTFNRKVRCQYVQTNRPWNVVGYGIEMSFVEAIKLEY
ncbi:MAG: hypothetical protein RBT76_15600 [candidate division Zixibacteria bacterium]|nr:hypothetical protein [candidate division Zixibacteria bacterium]